MLYWGGVVSHSLHPPHPIPGPRTDGVFLGLHPPTLTTLLNGRAPRSPPHILMLTCGEGPPLATYRGPEQYGEYQPRLGSLVGGLVSAVATGAAETWAAGRALLPRWRTGVVDTEKGVCWGWEGLHMCVCIFGCICAWYVCGMSAATACLLLFIFIPKHTHTHTHTHTHIHRAPPSQGAPP